MKKLLKYLIGISLVVLLCSCAKISEPGDFGMEGMKLGNGIPLAWGDLITVTSASESATFVQLWFQDKEGNVYLVVYDTGNNKFSGTYRYLKRI